MSALLNVLSPALQASAKVIVLCGVGIVMMWNGTMPPVKQLSSMLVKWFIPTLIFSNVIVTPTFEMIKRLWPITACAFAYVLLSMLAGYVLGRFLLRLSHDLALFFGVCCAFTNTTSIPLALVTSLSATTPALKLTPDETLAETIARGTAYVLFFTIFVMVLRWSIAYPLLAPPTARHGVQAVPQDDDTSNGDTRLSLRYVHDNDGDDGDRDRDGDGDEDADGENVPIVVTAHGIGSPLAPRPTTSIKVVPRWRSTLDKILSPPLISAVVSLVLAAIEPLRNLFVDPLAPFSFFYEASVTSGHVVVPLTMCILGANLSSGPMRTGATLPLRFLLGVGTFNLVVKPALCFLLILGIRSHLPPDPMIIMVLLLEAAMPSAINLTIMCSLHSYREKEISAILFWQYLASIFTVTVVSMFIIHLL